MNRNSKILIPFMLPVSLKREGMADKTQAVSEEKDLMCQSALKGELVRLADRDSTVTKKRYYQKMAIIPVTASLQQCILVGSNTHVDIELGGVSIMEFEEDAEISTEDMIFNL